MDQTEQVLLTATYNRGNGLWTNICLAFTNLSGTISYSYLFKQTEMVNVLKKKIMLEAKNNNCFNVREFRIVYMKGLSAIATAVADKKITYQDSSN